MKKRTTKLVPAFSLVELVVVVMIIGMISSMVIPRMSRGAVGANEATLAGSLNVVRSAILHYAVEHRNKFPGPTADVATAQLTQYSTLSGTTSPTPTAAAIYGPYLINLPPCPIGHNPGSSEILIDNANSPPEANGTSSAGWIYNSNTGEFYPNASDAELLTMQANIISAVKSTESMGG